MVFAIFKKKRDNALFPNKLWPGEHLAINCLHSFVSRQYETWIEKKILSV